MGISQIDGEIPVELTEEILKTLPTLKAIHSSEHSILIHIMGGQTRSFFKELKQNKAMEVLWTDWIGKSWWSYVFSFIPGQAGLIRVLDRNRLDHLIEELRGMSYCGVYFIPNHKAAAILEEVKQKDDNILKVLESETDFFILNIDFDYYPADRDAMLYHRYVVTGNNLNEEIKRIITRLE